MLLKDCDLLARENYFWETVCVHTASNALFCCLWLIPLPFLRQLVGGRWEDSPQCCNEKLHRRNISDVFEWLGWWALQPLRVCTKPATSLVWAGSRFRLWLRKCTLLESYSDPGIRIWGSVSSCHVLTDLLKELTRANSIWGLRLFNTACCSSWLLAFIQQSRDPCQPMQGTEIVS